MMGVGVGGISLSPLLKIFRLTAPLGSRQGLALGKESAKSKRIPKHRPVLFKI